MVEIADVYQSQSASYSRPVPTSGGGSAPISFTEGSRRSHKGMQYSVTPYGREWVWNVYNNGVLMQSGSVMGSQAAATASAKDWIDQYVMDEPDGDLKPGKPDPGLEEFTEEDLNAMEQESEELVRIEKPPSIFDNYEFLGIGLLAMIALVMVFLGDGDE